MLSLFQRKRVPLTTAAAPPPVEPAKGLTPPKSATSLLAEPHRQRLLEHIWQRTSLSRRQFRSLYLAPLERYAELVQQSRPRRRITMPFRAACWTAAWRSWPTRSS